MFVYNSSSLGARKPRVSGNNARKRKKHDCQNPLTIRHGRMLEKLVVCYLFEHNNNTRSKWYRSAPTIIGGIWRRLWWVFFLVCVHPFFKVQGTGSWLIAASRALALWLSRLTVCTQAHRHSWRALRIEPDIRSVQQVQLRIVSGGLILIAQFSVSPQPRFCFFCSVHLSVFQLSVCGDATQALWRDLRTSTASWN